MNGMFVLLLLLGTFLWAIGAGLAMRVYCSRHSDTKNARSGLILCGAGIIAVVLAVGVSLFDPRQAVSAQTIELSSLGCIVTSQNGKRVTSENLNTALLIPRGSTLTGECTTNR